MRTYEQYMFTYPYFQMPENDADQFSDWSENTIERIVEERNELNSSEQPSIPHALHDQVMGKTSLVQTVIIFRLLI